MNFKTLINEDNLQKRVKTLAEEIENDYEDEDINLICILKGSFIFTADLSRYINKNVSIDFIDISSYRNDKREKINTDNMVIPDVNNKNVIIVEDIIDSGYTMKFLTEEIKKHNPKSVKVCTLLDKHEKRLTSFEADYVGFTIDDIYVLGYGMDSNQKYRNIPFIAYKDLDEEKENIKIKKRND